MIDPYKTNLDPTIKAKITQLQNAERQRAFAGALPLEDRKDAEEVADYCRYVLEQTILTHLKRK